jgi:hypothetical protein
MTGGRRLDPEPWTCEFGSHFSERDRVKGHKDWLAPREVIFASTAATPNVATAYDSDENVCALCWGIIPPDGVTMVPDDGELCPGHRAHESNPILVAFREDVRNGTHADAVEWLEGDIVGDFPLSTELTRAHARAVLTRYLAVFG